MIEKIYLFSGIFSAFLIAITFAYGLALLFCGSLGLELFGLDYRVQIMTGCTIMGFYFWAVYEKLTDIVMQLKMIKNDL